MKNRTSGFTLVELVVTMAVASVLILAGGTVLVSGNRTYHRYALSVRAGELGETIAEQMRTRLQYATDILVEETQDEDIRNETGETSYIIGFTEDGRFLLDGEEVYGSLPDIGFLGGCRITRLAEEVPVVQVEVYLTDLSGNTLYQSRELIKLFNMELSGETVGWRIDSGDEVIDSADRDVFFCYLERGGRYEEDD